MNKKQLEERCKQLELSTEKIKQEWRIAGHDYTELLKAAEKRHGIEVSKIQNKLDRIQIETRDQEYTRGKFDMLCEVAKARGILK